MAILSRIEATGAELSVHGGQLLVAAPGGRSRADVSATIERLERLLVGWLAGQLVRCELTRNGKHPAPPAQSSLIGGLAACEAHSSGEMPA